MSTAVRRRTLSTTEALALPAMPTAQDAFAALNISEDLGYQLIKDGEFPIEVIKLGVRALRVRRNDLLNFLGITEENADAAGYQPAAPAEHTVPPIAR